MFRVVKFGGTSVANANILRKVIDIIKSSKKQTEQLIVVVSAQSGITDKLLQVGKMIITDKTMSEKLVQEIEEQHLETVRQLLPIEHQASALAEVMVMCNELKSLVKGANLLQEVTVRTQSLLVSFGERLSAFVITQAMKDDAHQVEYVDAREIIQTENAQVNVEISNSLIQQRFVNQVNIFVVTGFIASTIDGQTTTLGRGGSDYTASILGAALQAKIIEIWTDVNGVMTADPRFVAEAQTIDTLTYNEAMELSHFGAKVIFSATMLPAMKANIPIVVKNTFNPTHAGTLISNKVANDSNPIKGITCLRKMALFNVEGIGMAGVAGFSARLFSTLSQHQINVVLISQASSEHSICFAISQEFAELALRVLSESFDRELEKGLINPIQYEMNLAIVAVVGESMKKHAGLAVRVFNPLGKNGINLKAIAQGSSELNISVVILEADLEKTLRVLHQSLFHHDRKKVHVYMLGFGSIGKRMLEMILENSQFLEHEKIDLQICGAINSTKMFCQEKAVATDMVLETLQTSEKQSNLNEFVQNIISQNLENSLVLDVTASDEPTPHYLTLLSQNVNVVSANKRANTQSFEYYQQLQHAAINKNVGFQYETNVGAGLPVINVLKDLKAGGDKVIKIEAVLSGTMNYLLSEYDNAIPFSTLVAKAKELGYTEPDPRDDLSGMDVARKCLILAREIGWQMELKDIVVEPLMNEAAANANDIPQFFTELQSFDKTFETQYNTATSKRLKLRYVALLENGKAHVKVMELDDAHSFYTLKGTENCLAITTNYYQKYPMVIKGPGAGVDVTAAGVLADVIRIAKSI